MKIGENGQRNGSVLDPGRFITARKRSWKKVMFSQAPVCWAGEGK